MNKRQMVNIYVDRKRAIQIDGKECLIIAILASRGPLITDVSVFAESRDGSPVHATWILADAPGALREMVQEAFRVAFAEVQS